MLNIMYATGEQETLDSYKLEYLDYWIHPETGDKFSHGWNIKVPEKDIELEVTPTVANQLLHQKLWEGSCNVKGKVAGKDVEGKAYVELFLKNTDARIVRLAKLLPSVARVWEWWDKIELVFAAALILLIFNKDFLHHFALLPLLAVYMAFAGSYGYSINSYADREQDRIAGKVDKLQYASNYLIVIMICFFASGTIIIPLLSFDFRIAALGLITFFLTTFYSVRPLRLKERGFLGIITPALAQRTLPFLMFSFLIVPSSILVWFLAGWLTMAGVTVMFAHQLLDFNNDKNAKVNTWAQRVGFDWTKRTVKYSLLLTMFYMMLPIAIFDLGEGIAIATVLLASSYIVINYSMNSLKEINAAPRK